MNQSRFDRRLEKAANSDTVLVVFLVLFLLSCWLLLEIASYVHEKTWPLWPILIVSALSWAILKNRENWWARATTSVLSSISIGLAVLLAAVLLLNMSPSMVTPEQLAKIEVATIDVQTIAGDWSSFSLLVFILIVLLLWYADYRRPTAKLLARFFRYKGYISKFVVVLTTITTFSFFSDRPLEKFADEVHEQIIAESQAAIERYRILLRDQIDSVGVYLAAELVEEALADISTEEAHRFRDFLSAVNSLVDANIPDGKYLERIPPPHQIPEADLSRFEAERIDVKKGIVVEAARQQAEVALQTNVIAGDDRIEATPASPQGTSRQHIELDVEAIHNIAMLHLEPLAEMVKMRPTSKAEWERIGIVMQEMEELLVAERKAFEETRLKAEARVLAVKKVFAKLISPAASMIEGLAGEYIQEIINKATEHVVVTIERFLTEKRVAVDLTSITNVYLAEITPSSVLYFEQLTILRSDGVAPEALLVIVQEIKQQSSGSKSSSITGRGRRPERFARRREIDKPVGSDSRKTHESQEPRGPEPPRRPVRAR